MLPLRKLLSRAPSLPQPGRPFYAIGDIHGRADLLDRLLERIALRDDGAEAAIVCLGDYIDRGEDSAGVLRRLAAMVGADPGRVICLSGNHEAMMLGFLDAPEAEGPRWLRNGGLQTLASFGIGALSESSEGGALGAARDDLAAKLEAEGLRGFLDGLPRFWLSGGYAAVHAGADPDRPLEAQEPHHLLWGHPEFPRRRRADGLWLVHGHRIVPEPLVAAGRIAIDTGAYATGRLTAAHVSAGGVEFLWV